MKHIKCPKCSHEFGDDQRAVSRENADWHEQIIRMTETTGRINQIIQEYHARVRGESQ